MPCRPASHDFRAEDGAASRSSVLRSLAQRKTTCELLLAWATHPDYSFSSSLKARARLAIDQEFDDAVPTCPSSAGSGAQDRVGEWALGLAFRANREETALCEARCVLARALRIVGAPPAKLAASVEEQLSLHRAHRLGDRAAVRANIESALAGHKAAKPSRKGDDQRAKLQESLAALDRMSDIDLLEDRESLKKLWP